VTLRLLTYNIRYGGEDREEPLAAVIRSVAPHIVLLQEATRPEVVARLAADTGLSTWGAQRGQSLAYLSGLPVSHAAWHHPRGSRHAFLEVVPADWRVRIFGVHLSAVHAAWTERRRERELRALLGAIKAHQDGVHVLAGDFNTVAPGELLDLRRLPHRLRTLVWLSGGSVRWRVIQMLLDGGYVDGYRRLHPDVIGGFTFPTWDPHIRLDYVFVPRAESARVRCCEVIRLDECVKASDHFPLLAELTVDGEGAADETPSATPGHGASSGDD
jgi:exodeoxyribonuclease III